MTITGEPGDTVIGDGGGEILIGTNPDIVSVEEFIFSVDDSGTLPDDNDAPFDDSDLIRFDDPAFNLFFEGSNVIAANIDALQMFDADTPTFYFSDSSATDVFITEEGNLYQDENDIPNNETDTGVKWTNDVLFWDGTDVVNVPLPLNPLLPSGFDIDAVWFGFDGDGNPTGDVVISTTDDVALDDWKFDDLPFSAGDFGLTDWQNEDLLLWDANAGANGEFSMFFDGSENGLSDADFGGDLNINAVDVVDVGAGAFVFSLDGVISGGLDLGLGGDDVLPADLVLWNGSEFSVVFDGSVDGITGFDSDSDDIFGATVLSFELGTEGGEDTLVGGSLDDVLVGRAGTDTLTGGTGSDTFVMQGEDLVNATNTGGTTDTITDFETDADTLDLSDIFSDAGIVADNDGAGGDDNLQFSSDGSGNTEVRVDTTNSGDFSGDPVVVLLNVNPGDLSTDPNSGNVDV